MARAAINLGVAPTGQGGDTFRTASQKNNDNSAELYAALGADGQGALPAALPVAKGGTGGGTAAAARTALGVDVTLASAVLDPANGGVMSISTVSGFTVSKYLNGDLWISGSLGNSPIAAVNGFADATVTIPSGFIGISSISIGHQPAGNIDCYGVAFAFPVSNTAVRYAIRNGATAAQNFLVNALIKGRWK